MRKLQNQTIITFLMIVVISTTLTPLCSRLCYAQDPSSFICPNPTSISPCTCIPFTGYRQSINNGIKIDCARKNVTDSQISRVFNVFLAPGLSLVQEISAPFNQLTKIPNQVSKFIALAVLDFSNNRISEIPCDDGKPFVNNRYPNDTDSSIKISLRSNLIRRIPSGVFHFPSSFKVEIDLTDNKIASVLPDAFRLPQAVVVSLSLESNEISAFPDGIFNYPKAIYLTLRLGGNQVKNIPSVAVFNFPSAKSVSIMLDSNKITSISKDSFSFTFNLEESIYIDLSRNNITMIPCGTFNYPLSGSVYVHLNYNQIKTVPSCAFNFPSARYGGVGLSHNLITTISPGVFNFPSGVFLSLSLKYNQISTIPPDTFAQGVYYSIDLSNNQLKRFESAVFKSPMTKPNIFTTTDNYILIQDNPIDCLTDPCHLAWLLQGANSSQLLRRVSAFGVCSNMNGGTPFLLLNSFDFSKNCVCSFN